MKIFSTSVVSREMQINVRYQFKSSDGQKEIIPTHEIAGKGIHPPKYRLRNYESLHLFWKVNQ